MPDTVRHLSSITFFNPHFGPAGCYSPRRTGEPVLAPSTCGTRLSSLGHERRGSHSNPVLSDSQAQLSPAWAESPKRKAGGDRAVSSEHPGMTFSVPVADSSLSIQTAVEPWVWDPPLGKVKAAFPSSKDRVGSSGGSQPCQSSLTPQTGVSPSGKTSWFLSPVSTAGSLREQERGQIPSSPPLPTLTWWSHLNSWPQTHSLTISTQTGTQKLVEWADLLPAPFQVQQCH